MARIPESELERLKAEVSLERLAESQGIRLAVHGADRIGLCPFHDDTEPSLVITPAKNLSHCLGACQAGGSVIDWVMRAEGVSFRRAVELLRRGTVAQNRPDGNTEFVERLRSRRSERFQVDVPGQQRLDLCITPARSPAESTNGARRTSGRRSSAARA